MWGYQLRLHRTGLFRHADLIPAFSHVYVYVYVSVNTVETLWWEFQHKMSKFCIEVLSINSFQRNNCIYRMEEICEENLLNRYLFALFHRFYAFPGWYECANFETVAYGLFSKRLQCMIRICDFVGRGMIRRCQIVLQLSNAYHDLWGHINDRMFPAQLFFVCVVNYVGYANALRFRCPMASASHNDSCASCS